MNNQYFNRILDGLLILVATSIITFLFVRIDLTINSLNFLYLLSVIVLLGLLTSSTFRKLLLPAGLITSILLLLLCFVFPTFTEINIFQQIIFSGIWILISTLYIYRSFRSSQKLLLKFLGFLGVFILLITAINYLPESINNILSYKLDKPFIIKAGDPLADLRLNPSVSPEMLVVETKRLGLDKPLFYQYFLWLDSVLLHFDFGVTQQGERVVQAVSTPLRNTILLNSIVIFLSWLISIPLGVLAAVKKDTIIDKSILTLSSLSLTIPSFLISILVLSISLRAGIGVIGGITSIYFDDLNIFEKILDIAQHLLLPVFVLTFVGIGMLIRQMRGNLLDVLNDDYVKASKARGLSQAIVLWKHAVPNSINPLITLLGFEFANLISGAALTEMILNYPGIGALTLVAAKKMDINLIMFMLLLGTTMLLVGNLLADFLLNYCDPRTRVKR